MHGKGFLEVCVAIYGACMNSNPVVISTLPHLFGLWAIQESHTLQSVFACKTFKFDPCLNAWEGVLGSLCSYIWCLYELKPSGHIYIAPSIRVMGHPGVPHTAKCVCMQNV